MFAPETYKTRRQTLAEKMGSGLLLFVGNEHSPMTFVDMPYPFQQDGSFLYYWGHDEPALAGVMDLDTGREYLCGEEPTLDDIIWTGDLPSMADRATACGCNQVLSPADLPKLLITAKAKGRAIHYLPPYRASSLLKIAGWLDVSPAEVEAGVSLPLIKAVVAMRSIKSDEEVAELEEAVALTAEMQLMVMREARPGITERELSARVIMMAEANYGYSFAPIITVNGHFLHAVDQSNVLKNGQFLINDCGACSAGRYAGDITRTFPVSGKFDSRQKAIYQIEKEAQESAIRALKPGVLFRDIHYATAHLIVQGLIDLGLLKGKAEDVVANNAHTLFWQAGLGHMLGLDVHDMEALGEDHVGYTEDVVRETRFGGKRLRMAKALEAGHVMTVEPGIYFNPGLIDQFQAEGRHSDFIEYAEVAKYRDFTGIRIEDDVLVTPDGYKVLGPPIAKEITEIENLTGG